MAPGAAHRGDAALCPLPPAGAARAVAGAAGRGEVLHNSLSDGFYQVPNKQQGDSTERVCSQPPQPRPRNVRQAMDSMTDPRYLKDSLSGGRGAGEPGGACRGGVLAGTLAWSVHRPRALEQAVQEAAAGLRGARSRSDASAPSRRMPCPPQRACTTTGRATAPTP